jgi:hypothetical protein
MSVDSHYTTINGFLDLAINVTYEKKADDPQTEKEVYNNAIFDLTDLFDKINKYKELIDIDYQKSLETSAQKVIDIAGGENKINSILNLERNDKIDECFFYKYKDAIVYHISNQKNLYFCTQNNRVVMTMQ